MTAKYQSIYNNEKFNSYEEAWEYAMREMEFNDLLEEFEDRVDYASLLNWATQQPHFYDEFADVVSDIEQKFFDTFFEEVE